MRELIRTRLVPWAEKNGQVQVRAVRRSGKHPLLRGYYINGNSKEVGVKNLTVTEISAHMQALRDSTGQKVVAEKMDVKTKRPSIQGPWTPQVSQKLQGMTFSLREIQPVVSAAET